MSSDTAKLYVGNLSWNSTDETLRTAFEPYGTVTDTIVMRDRDTGRSRGFGFVTFAEGVNGKNEIVVATAAADAAIENMNEQELDGRRIKVNLANARGAGGGGGGGGGGYGGGYQSGGYGGGGYNGGTYGGGGGGGAYQQQPQNYGGYGGYGNSGGGGGY